MSHIRAFRYLQPLLAGVMALLVSAVALAGDVGGVKGKILSPEGDQGVSATVILLTSRGTQVAQTTTNAEGEFELTGVPVGSYVLRVEANQYAPFRSAVEVRNQGVAEVSLRVSIAPVEDQVTVTANAGEAQSIFSSAKSISVLSAEDLRRRPTTALPQALRETPNVHVQQTTTSQGSVFLRGVTGQRVVALIDGVRYNNSTFRPGPTQYLATVPLQSAGAVEVVNGPSSVQYGSDGLGGTINVVTAQPFFTTGGREIHAEIATHFGSADVSGGGSARVTFGTEKLSVLVGGSFVRANDLRTGGGIDSRSAVTRFLGISSKFLGDRLQDTAFSQGGGEARIYFKPTATQQISLAYLRNDLRGNRRYDQLNGGNGNLIQGFVPQTLDFFYGRYQKQQVSIFDSVTGTFSFNRQRDDRQSQGGNGNPLGLITTEFNKTDAFGYSLQATTHFTTRNALFLGAEIYDENIDSTSFTTNPANNAVAAVRGRFPNQAQYKTFGFYFEDTQEVIPGKFRVSGGLRYGVSQFTTRAADDVVINGRPQGLDSSVRFDAVTFNTGGTVTPFEWLAIYGTVSRGFRAPNVNDLGGVGITSNGFSVTADQGVPLGLQVGTSAAAAAGRSNIPLAGLSAEKAMNYEAGVRVKFNRIEGSFGGFVSNLQDVTAVRAVVAPAGQNLVGQSIAGRPIVRQNPNGTIFIADSAQPVIARVNTGDVRFSGVDASVKFAVTPDISIRAHGFYLRSRDRNATTPLQAPDFEGGLPPTTGFLSVKYQPRGARYWIETYSTMATEQDRLSSVDIDDQRQGASRSRNTIATFFNNGARARGLVSPGADGRVNTADDLLIPTGETLLQIQNRVIGSGVAAGTLVPLFQKTAGYATLNFRGGFRVSENSDFVFIMENVLDKNYRIHGSGTDAPGANFVVRYQIRF